MKNVLSYQIGSRFSGREINEFLKARASHIKWVKTLYSHYNLKDDAIYELCRLPFGPGTDACRTNELNKLGFRKVST